jgi:hypothetical protein
MRTLRTDTTTLRLTWSGSRTYLILKPEQELTGSHVCQSAMAFEAMKHSRS